MNWLPPSWPLGLRCARPRPLVLTGPQWAAHLRCPGGEDRSFYYFTKEGAPRQSWWRLAQGRLVEDRLEREGYVGQIEDYLYPDFGLAAGPSGTGDRSEAISEVPA